MYRARRANPSALQQSSNHCQFAKPRKHHAPAFIAATSKHNQNIKYRKLKKTMTIHVCGEQSRQGQCSMRDNACAWLLQQVTKLDKGSRKYCGIKPATASVRAAQQSRAFDGRRQVRLDGRPLFGPLVM
jgi:hypothetical protein